MTSTIRLLATVSIVALAITVAAPATKAASKSAAAAPAAKTVKGVVHSSHKNGARRGKRSVIVQVPVEIEDDVVDEDAELERDLSLLSDSELQLLAGIVQEELDRYNPEQEEYEIVDIPIEYLQRGYPRDRRSVPVIEDDNEDEEEQLVFVPQEVLEEALVEEAIEEAAQQQLVKELDEMELRVRIGEMADILNERASRNSRRR